MTIFDRLLFKRLFKNFIYIFFSLLFFFTVFDMTMMKSLPNRSMLLHYGSTYSLQAEFLISIAFALALIRTLLEANSNFELASLQIAGTPLLKITRMIFVFAALLTCLNIINFQYWYPKAAKVLQKNCAKSPRIVRVILPDNASLFFNGTLSNQEVLKDLFLIKSEEEIWHIHSLEKSPPYLAKGIDCFIRKNDKIEYASSLEYSYIDLSEAEMIPNSDLYINFSLKKLSKLLDKPTTIPLDIHKIQIQLYNKWLMITLPLLLCFLILPLTTKYYKVMPSLRIYGISLFVFILSYFIIRVSIILAQSELLPPFAIVAFPLSLLLVSLNICGERKLFSLSIFSRSS